MLRVVCFSATVLIFTNGFAQQKPTREQMVRADREKVEAQGFWIYNNLPKAFEEAKQTGKPILVVLRCIPCEECVKLDDELVEKDPIIQPLLQRFVCARQVSTNGLDLNLFQFDTDQSFAVFLLNADKTIYGRFGTRSHRTEWLGDVSLTGLAKAMQGALDLHANYPANAALLEGKLGKPMEVASPEKYPALKDRFTDKLDYEGNVVKSCIHCHQIGDAQRKWYRDAGKPLPEKVLFPYPHPKSLGLIFDPKEKATVSEVVEGSPAAQAGFKAGDRLEQFAGQVMLSIADVQWVLHNVDPKGGEVLAQVQRGDKTVSVPLTLTKGWRREGDITWRATSWGLRGMVTGGLVLESLEPGKRDSLKLPENKMALRVKHVGQYGAHAAAKKAGVQVGDIIIEFDDKDDLITETDVLSHGVTMRKAGDLVSVKILRDGRQIAFKLPQQP